MPGPKYTILGTGSEFDGHTIEQWTESWWQWAVKFPTGEDKNPFQDLDGSEAGAGDVGDVFFVAGIAGGNQKPAPEIAVAERSFEVSADDTILVPAINWAQSVPTIRQLNNDPKVNIKDVEKWVDDTKSQVTDAFVEIDGKKVFDYDPMHSSFADKYYVETGIFSLGKVSPGDIGYDEFGLRPAGVEQEPAAGAGYWVAIQDLDPGKHEVRFGGSFDLDDDGKDDFAIDITDKITVVSPNGYQDAGCSSDYVFG